jgi:sortase A
MRIVVKKRSVQLALRSLQCVFFAAAAALLAYCAFVLVDAWSFQKAQRLELDRLLAAQADQSVRTVTLKTAPPVAQGSLMGRMEISRLGVSVILIEGTSATTLRRAAGHISGTALPGQAGNVGIAAHRDTFFRPLRNIRQNDIITLTTLLGTFRYRVMSTKIVSPSDVTVLTPGGNEILTLVTCYPFYFVGSAPDRFIVRAERVV